MQDAERLEERDPGADHLDFLQALCLRDIYATDRIDRAGLGWVFAEAEWRWSEMVRKAAEALAPLGITTDALEEMLHEWSTGESSS